MPDLVENVNLMENIKKLLDRPLVNRHSFFQLKYFVVEKEPTHQKRMWRCLEELRVRKEGIDAIDTQIEDSQDQIELISIEITRLNRQEINDTNIIIHELNCREKEIKIKQLNRKQKSIFDNVNKLQKTRSEQLEEAEFFLKSFISLEKLEPLKPFDDFNSQMEYWNERYANMINMRMLLGLPMDPELITSALSLPQNSNVRQQVVSLLENQAKQLKTPSDNRQHTE